MTPWIQDWVAALESGYFRQGINPRNSWDPEGHYSALGVLCEINGCTRKTVDLDQVRTVIKERLCQSDTNPDLDFESVVDTAMQRFAMTGTSYYYTYRDQLRTHEHMTYIPIGLTAKLNCNASLDLLSIVRTHSIITVEGVDHHPSVAALDSHGVPFKAIAAFIRDVWPALAFKTAEQYEPIYKDYCYFKLQRL